LPARECAGKCPDYQNRRGIEARIEWSDLLSLNGFLNPLLVFLEFHSDTVALAMVCPKGFPWM